jgi:predicted TIM-barrel fold metal-dependent hydrolase
VIIDIHTHVGDFSRAAERTPVTVENLLARLDEEGIDRAVILPFGDAPEAMEPPYLFSAQASIVSQIETSLRYPERLIPFGNVDPRMGGNAGKADFSWILDRFVAMGCVGIGEVTANLPADDPRVINLFRQCGAYGLPVTIDTTGPGEGRYGLIDDPGSPRMARLLEAAPETIVLGHGPGFWAEISADVSVKTGYPTGPVTPEGSLSRLLRTYPNLYADISARSGFNGLTRDEAFGVAFLNEFQDKLVFGTDVCFGDAEGRMPHLAYLRRLLAEGRLSQDAFDKITAKNALRVMPRYAAGG